MAAVLQPDSLAADESALVYPVGEIIWFISSLDSSTLTLLPAVFLLVLSPLHLAGYRDKLQLVAPRRLLWFKLISAGALACMETATVIAWVSVANATWGDVAAAIVSAMASIFLIAIINIEHRYTFASTPSIAIWFASSLLLDGLRVQAYVGRPELGEVTVFAIFSASLKGLLLLLNELPKKAGIKDALLRSQLNIGATSGFWSRSLIIWLSQAVAIGFNGVPQFESIPEPSVTEKLSATITENSAPGRNSSSRWLFSTVFRALILLLSGTLIPQLLFSAFQLSQVTFLKRFLIFMSAPGDFMGTTPGLVSAIVFIQFGRTISRTSFQEHSDNASAVIRGALTKATCSKLLSLPCSERQRLKASNVVSTQIEGFVAGILSLYDIIGDSIQLIVCMSWLTRLAGHTAGILFVLFGIFYAFIIWVRGNNVPNARQAWDKSARLYVLRVSQMLSQIKAIRMIGLDTVVYTILERIRFSEVQTYVTVRYWSSVQISTTTLFHAIPGPIVISQLYLRSAEGIVTATEVYLSLLIVSIMYDATMTVANAYSTVMSMFHCITCIQNFLVLEEQQELVPMQIIDEVEVSDGDEYVLPPGRVMEFRDAYLAASPSSRDDPLLHNLNLIVQSCEIVMVAGPIGCGKSVLLRSLTGEGIFVSGSLTKMAGVSGYCDQTPWLQYASIRDNIIGHKDFSMEWYNTVVQACLLQQDFEGLPSGDESLVGNGGSNLSNGQVYRIALARALYMRAPYLVLDNIFSALDRETSEELFARLFGSHGLIRQVPSTVIMTTYSIYFLEQADRVFLIDLDGVVSMHTDTHSTEFRERLTGIGLAEEDADTEQQIDETALPCNSTPLSERVGRKKSIISLIAFYMTFFKLWAKFVWVSCISIAVITLAAPVFILRKWLESPPGDNNYLLAYGVVAAISCISIVIALSVFFSTMVPHSSLEFHRILLSAIMRAKVSFLTQTSHRSLLHFFDVDLNILSDSLPRFMQRVIYIFILILAYLGILANASPLNFFTLPIYIGLVSVASWFYMHMAVEGHCADVNCRSALKNHLTEVGAGLRHIKAFGWQKEAAQKSNDLLFTSQCRFRRTLFLNRWLDLVVDAARSLATVAIVVLAVYNPMTISTAGAGVSLVALKQCTDSVVQFIKDCAELDMGACALEKLQNIVNGIPQETPPSGKSPKLDNNWPHSGRVIFRDITARYDAKSTAPAALKNVSVAIAPGYKVAVVGRTGSGKSSLLMGLLNFLDYQGTIKIDGVDISTIPHRVLREHITTISQDVIDLGGSLLFNLCPWTMIESETEGNVNMEGVCLVLEALNLFEAVGGIEGLYKPLSSLKLSHGQLQLVSIARGMLRNLAMGSRLVVMDETTYNMDPATAELVQNALNETFPDHTVITVVHDEETTMDVDLTIRMKNGHISSKVVNPNGPAARKAAEKKEAADRAAAAAARRRAAAGPSAPRPPIPPHYQRLMNLQVEPDAEELIRPHLEAETELRERWLARKGKGYYALGTL